jgi:hypothetical protein
MKNIKFLYFSTNIRHWYAHLNRIIHILCNKLLFSLVFADRFKDTWPAVKSVACYRMLINVPIKVRLWILPSDSSLCLTHFGVHDCSFNYSQCIKIPTISPSNSKLQFSSNNQWLVRRTLCKAFSYWALFKTKLKNALCIGHDHLPVTWHQWIIYRIMKFCAKHFRSVVGFFWPSSQWFSLFRGAYGFSCKLFTFLCWLKWNSVSRTWRKAVE